MHTSSLLCTPRLSMHTSSFYAPLVFAMHALSSYARLAFLCTSLLCTPCVSMHASSFCAGLAPICMPRLFTHASSFHARLAFLCTLCDAVLQVVASLLMWSEICVEAALQIIMSIVWYKTNRKWNHLSKGMLIWVSTSSKRFCQGLMLVALC